MLYVWSAQHFAVDLSILLAIAINASCKLCIGSCLLHASSVAKPNIWFHQPSVSRRFDPLPKRTFAISPWPASLPFRIYLDDLISKSHKKAKGFVLICFQSHFTRSSYSSHHFFSFNQYSHLLLALGKRTKLFALKICKLIDSVCIPRILLMCASELALVLRSLCCLLQSYAHPISWKPASILFVPGCGDPFKWNNCRAISLLLVVFGNIVNRYLWPSAYISRARKSAEE